MKSPTRGITVSSTRKRTGRGIVSASGAGGRSVVENVMRQAGEQSVQVMRTVIETTPSGIVKDKPDRVWTGKMRDSVNYQIVNMARGKYRLRVGWTGTREDYFLWQDSGDPQRSGQWPIKGMMMLFQGYLVARDEVRKGIEQSQLVGK